MTQTPRKETFDVFLSYNSKDRAEVKEIAQQLKERGMRPWLDEWEIRPGSSWLDALEKQIDTIQAAAVFVGKEGIGPWQHMEVNAYLRKFVSRGCPVIPVLLKDAAQKPPLPIFLHEVNYVDFRALNQDLAPIDRLIWGITGKKPDALPSSASSQDDTNTAKISTTSLSFQKKSELVNKLIACPTMKDRHARDIVVLQLSDQIARSIARHAVDVVDVTNIVSTCTNFSGGIQELVEVVGFFEGDSIPMQQLRAFLQSL